MNDLTGEQIKQAVDEAQRALDSSWYDRIRELGDMALRTLDAEDLIDGYEDRLAAIERQVRELADDKEAEASRLHYQGCELLASDEYEEADRLRAIIDAPDAGGEG